ASQKQESLDVVALSPRAELESFIRRIVPISAISNRMLRSRTFGYVTAALPGLEAFLLLERIRALGGDASLNDRYVVIDAPASGSAFELLGVATGTRGIAPLGTLNRMAAGLESFLTDHERFAALVVLAPEDLAIREAIATIQGLRDELHVAVLAAIVNRVPQRLFDDRELESIGSRGAHAQLARRRVDQHDAAENALRQLAEAGVATLELPMLFRAAIGARELEEIARHLETGLLAS